MADIRSDRQNLKRRSGYRFRVFALLTMIVLPLLLYLASEGGRDELVSILLGLMVMLMIGVIAIM